jgi:SAM-dependent methyltransferase
MNETDKAARHWDRVSNRPILRARNWWQSPGVIRHNNLRVCGQALNGFTAGTIERLASKIKGRAIKRAISVGCGGARKEISFLKSGAVDHFDLFEISKARVAQANEGLISAGLADRAVVHNEDAFAKAQGGYDLVYWASSLHHMPNAADAVKWSYDALAPGGIILVDDYFGPNRLQWTDRALEYANMLRASFDESLRRHAQDPDAIDGDVERPDLKTLIKNDPSEAADSEGICPALELTFKGSRVEWIGGAIYALALHNIVWNFNIQKATKELARCLAVDAWMTDEGERHNGFFIARKPQAWQFWRR